MFDFSFFFAPLVVCVCSTNWFRFSVSVVCVCVLTIAAGKLKKHNEKEVTRIRATEHTQRLCNAHVSQKHTQAYEKNETRSLYKYINMNNSANKIYCGGHMQSKSTSEALSSFSFEKFVVFSSVLRFRLCSLLACCF